MKKRLLICGLVAGLSAIVLSSYEHGPAYEVGLNRTGSEGGVTGCNGTGCHAANTAATIVTITVTTPVGAPVTTYIPGATYAVTILGHNTASGVTATEFGFQVSAVLSGNTQAGTFAVPAGVNTRVVPLTHVDIVEHKNPLLDSIDNYSVAHFSWTAPAAGSGTVRFFGVLNSLTDDGDEAYPNVADVVSIGEYGAAAIPQTPAELEDVAVTPNPFSDRINITYGINEQLTVNMYSLAGSTIYSGTESTINTGTLPAGVYFVKISSANASVVRTVVKQ